jgi:hypothetical protein
MVASWHSSGRKYAAGTPVQVYYDPANSQNAVLEVRSTGGCAIPVMAIVFLYPAQSMR